MQRKFIEIQWTSGSLDEARRICRYLVQERLVACAQIVPWIESIFMWNNQLETNQESKINMKAPSDNYAKIEEIIVANSSYQVPEIICHTIEGGLPVYLKWVDESVPSDFDAVSVKIFPE